MIADVSTHHVYRGSPLSVHPGAAVRQLSLCSSRCKLRSFPRYLRLQLSAAGPSRHGLTVTSAEGASLRIRGRFQGLPPFESCSRDAPRFPPVTTLLAKLRPSVFNLGDKSMFAAALRRVTRL